MAIFKRNSIKVFMFLTVCLKVGVKTNPIILCHIENYKSLIHRIKKIRINLKICL
jgi:hypothetical protein